MTKSSGKDAVSHRKFSLAEIVMCSTLYIVFVMRFCYLVYNASLAKEDMLSFDLHPSWWFGRRMDDSDYEWRYWVDYYSKYLPWYMGHACLGLAINCHLQKGRIYANILFSLVFLNNVLGLKQLTFLICNVCLVYLTVIVTKRKSMVWAVSLIILGLLNMKGTSDFIMSLCSPDPTGTRYLTLVYAMSINNLRLISLGIDMIGAYNRSEHLESFYRILAYALYTPTFFSGPFISYKTFINSISTRQEPITWPRIWRLLSESLQLVFYWIMMEILLHYFYSTALQQEEYFLISADNMTVFALCFVQAALFNLKYLVLYGVPTLFAEFDGVSMPPGPCCLLVEHRASRIWKLFDVGLYNFIIQYIYIPLGGSKLGLSQQVLTMFLCFIFIGFWHGAAVNIFIWVLINFLCIFLENLHKQMLKTRQWKTIETQVGEEAAYRLETLFFAPIGILSLWSMFVFLGSRNVGYNLYQKLLKNAHLEMRVTLVVLAYIYIIFSRSMEDRTLLQYISGLIRPKRRNSDTNGDNGKKAKHKHY